MKTTVDKILVWVLTPLSWIYGGITWLRNKLFDSGIFREEQFDIPVISVGNITIGGTGKTPHTEYIVSNLSSRYKMAVLSRGYKRKTRGYILANSKSTPDIIGDEPLQIYQKYGHAVKVAVCENRRKGITRLLQDFPDLELIVLDDAFQHRWVKPKVSVLLLDYNRPINKDKMLPLGRLREYPHAIYRADMVVVSKCPDTLSPINYRILFKELNLLDFQKLYFTSYENDSPRPVFPDDAPYHVDLNSLTAKDTVILLTGIAYPRHFVNQFRKYPFKVKVARFPDHHDFSREDILGIRKMYDTQKGERKIILTTEKDAVRLAYNPYYPTSLKPFTFYLPIHVNFLGSMGNSNFIEDLEQAIHKTGI